MIISNGIERSIKAVLALVILIFNMYAQEIPAQEYNGLISLSGYNASVYYSVGNDERARTVAERIDRVIDYFTKLIKFKPSVTILILAPDDWGKFTNFPVYGMPHYNDNETLIIASENNEFWNSFIPPLNQIPANLADKIKFTYSDDNGKLTMQPFFDLLAIHELGHAFHFQAELTMQRKWMGELFSNIFLHTYIAENEPEQLEALTVFPQMVIAGGKEGYKFTSLSDLEERYIEIASQFPRNYGWYQSRWHYEAGQIYDAGGVETFVKLWNALSDKKQILSDDDLAEFLSENVSHRVADVMLKWDE